MMNSSSNELRLYIENYLYSYESNKGIGIDAYCATPQCHPMADGKYLSTLAVLHRTRLVSSSNFSERVATACARLEKAILTPFKRGICWGLGFSWRNLPVTEPFLITSAIVTKGLLDCRNQGLESDSLSDLLRRGQEGLDAWRQELTAVAEERMVLPAYSPGIPEPIFNAAAYALSTLSLAHAANGEPLDPDAMRLLEWIRCRRTSGLGWKYSPNSPIVDLLHQAYILNALADTFGIQSVESTTIEMLGQFAAPCCFADALHLIEGSPDPLNEGGALRWLRPLGNAHVELLPKPARLWSLGELLVLLSRLATGKYAEAQVRLGRQIAGALMVRLALTDDKEANCPRHVMHALHGLACFLALLRKRAQGC